ncbi:hypothetical protein HBF26_17850 [Luteibacter jiangsuensis]|uniref:Uncharacterized protein n=1 Tax=Luteibacter jiangsuensis TaxID=637577 RepID=A0ABX0Q863_9GAMM|nr:hypothetical protein [Luteibacter jiangsuensis]NID06760.1 hypothetical protein [Luteibacter jiangsuensis]
MAMLFRPSVMHPGLPAEGILSAHRAIANEVWQIISGAMTTDAAAGTAKCRMSEEVVERALEKRGRHR